jgi:Putative zinc-finger
MGCAEVRELLPEYAVGTLDAATRARIEEHLARCAGCRKEANELAEGAAALALDFPSPTPPAELEDRVVDAIKARTERRPQRRTLVLAAVVAALAVSASIGWGLAIAARDEPADPDTSAAEAMRTLQSFQAFLVDVGGAGELESATLRPPRGGPAGGGATRYESTEREGDSLVVVVGGLRAEEGPFTVVLRSGGARLDVGTLEELSLGQMGLAEAFSRDLSGFGGIMVEGPDGRRVLSGSFER